MAARVYEACRDDMRSFDLLLFRNPRGVVPAGVSVLTRLGGVHPGPADMFGGRPPTHCGLVVRGEDIHSDMSAATVSSHRGVLYIYESTLSDGAVPRVDVATGRARGAHLGVQLRRLDEVLAHCRSAGVACAWAPLRGDARARLPDDAWARACAPYDGTVYDLNPCSLLATALPCFRRCRWGRGGVVCSELAALVLRDLGLSAAAPGDVLPADFMPRRGGGTWDADGAVPPLYDAPVFLT